MGKHADWSGVTEILGRAAAELRNEVKDVALSKSGNVRETLAGAVDDIAHKIRRKGTEFTRHTYRNEQHSINALPIVIGLAALAGVTAWLAIDHKSSETRKSSESGAPPQT